MIADYYCVIKVTIFQSISERQSEDLSYNCGRMAAKIERFNSVNSEIIGWMLTKFVYDVARILPFTIGQSALSNAEAKSEDSS